MPCSERTWALSGGEQDELPRGGGRVENGESATAGQPSQGQLSQQQPQFTQYDLGQLKRGSTVVVTLRGNAANLRLMTWSDLNNYKNRRNHHYYGGLAWIFHGCDGAGPLITARGF